MEVKERKFHWLAIKLVALISFIFVLQAIFPQITGFFATVPILALSQPWRLITHVFMHGGIEHLLYNMFALALFGTILEKIISWRRLLSLFLIGGVIAGIGSTAVFFWQGNLTAGSVGASGAIMAILGTLAVLRPRMIVYVTFVPLPMIIAAAFWAFLDLLGAFNPYSNVNNFAHLFGLGFGIIYGLLLWKNFGEPLFLKRKGDIKVSKEELDDWEEKWM